MEITLQLENFQGPLSLLCHLIDKNKIDIYDIPIYEITEQYLSVIEDAENQNMDVMSEFLLMAANLLEIKSRMLLPKQKCEEDETDPRLELVAKLIEYKKFKDVTDEFKKHEERAALNIFKAPDAALQLFKKEEPATIDNFLEGISFEDIYKAFQEVLRRKEQKVDKIRIGFNSVEKDLYTVGDKIKYIKNLLILSPKITFWEIFRENTEKIEIIITFVALLELIKINEVSISQNYVFGTITITKYNGCDLNEVK